MQNTGNHPNNSRGNQDEKGQSGEEQHQNERNSTPPQQSSYVRSSRREKKIKLERDESDVTRRNSEPSESLDTTLENVELARKVSPSSSAPAGAAGGSSGKKSKRGKKSTRVDMNAKLERSRQSARECRARKKLRYQYLEDLVNRREKAVFSLKKELDSYKDWCKQVDEGANPKEAFAQKIKFA